MRKPTGSSLVAVAASLIVLVLTVACVETEDVQSMLGGTHQLRKMMEQSSTTASLSGGYFLFVGSIAGGVTTETKVKFAWKMNDGAYAISSLNLEQIRIRFDDGATVPMIEFHLRSHRIATYDYIDQVPLQEVIDYFVQCAVVTVREADWPAQVQLPLNAK